MSDSSMDHHLFLLLLLAFPVVHCPITSVINALGDTEVDLSSITSHITRLEEQVSSLQHQFESDLKSTMTDLVSVRSELKASREEHDQLRADLNTKCQILKLASDELNVTRSEISRLKEECREVKTACVANVHSLTNVLEIVGAITTNISFEVSLSHPLHSVGDKETLKFDEVRVNAGYHYHKDTGAFTAPVSGSYMLWASIRLTEPNSFINIYVHSHNKVIGHGHAETSTSTPSVATLLTVTFLRVDDKVWFTKHSGSTVIHGDIHTSVTSIYGGALLRPH